jgi:hypothetical protein
LCDEEDDSNHTGLICSNNAYPRVDRVIHAYPGHWDQQQILVPRAGIIFSGSLTRSPGPSQNKIQAQIYRNLQQPTW